MADYVLFLIRENPSNPRSSASYFFSLSKQPAELGDDRVRVGAVVRDGRAVAGLEIFHLALAGSELGLADNNRGAKALAVGVLQLLAELLRLGIDLDAEARSAELRGELEIVVAARAVEHR